MMLHVFYFLINISQMKKKIWPQRIQFEKENDKWKYCCRPHWMVPLYSIDGCQIDRIGDNTSSSSFSNCVSFASTAIEYSNMYWYLNRLLAPLCSIFKYIYAYAIHTLIDGTIFHRIITVALCTAIIWKLAVNNSASESKNYSHTFHHFVTDPVIRKMVCVVCQVTLLNGDVLTTTKCGHWFHRDCLQQQLQQ